MQISEEFRFLRVSCANANQQENLGPVYEQPQALHAQTYVDPRGRKCIQCQGIETKGGENPRTVTLNDIQYVIKRCANLLFPL